MGIEQGAVGRLRTRFHGALLRPGVEGYDEARRIWNGAIDRRPALIARCGGSADVVEAVRFAREQDLLVSVRGGGHAVAGHAVCDGGPPASGRPAGARRSHVLAARAGSRGPAVLRGLRRRGARRAWPLRRHDARATDAVPARRLLRQAGRGDDPRVVRRPRRGRARARTATPCRDAARGRGAPGALPRGPVDARRWCSDAVDQRVGEGRRHQQSCPPQPKDNGTPTTVCTNRSWATVIVTPWLMSAGHVAAALADAIAIVVWQGSHLGSVE